MTQCFARTAGREAIYIPPRSLASVRVTGGGLQRTGQDVEILVEPLADGGPAGLLVASTLNVAQGNSLYVQVLNVTEEAIVIRPGTRIGKVQTVDRKVANTVDVEVRCNNIVISCDMQDRTEPAKCPVDLSEACASKEEKARLEELILKNKDMFFQDDDDLGHTTREQHRIRLKDDEPVTAAFRRIPPSQFQEVKEHIQGLLDKNIIHRSNSPYASPVVIVWKKDGSIRLCVDYRKLNAKTKMDAWPLPRIDDSLDALGGSSWFSTLDLASGYHQVPMHPDDREKTAFVTPFGLFEYLRMPMGLSTAPATFQRLMQTTMNDLAFQILLIYLNDLLIYSKTFEDHLERLNIVFDRLTEIGLKLNPTKCKVARKSVEYLGYTISGEGIATSRDKIRAVADWPTPQTLRELRGALGFFSYYRRFVAGFAKLAQPMNQLVSQILQRDKAKRAKSRNQYLGNLWTADCQRAFEALKTALTTAPVLGYADYTRPFILETDGSFQGLGAVLSQDQEGGHRVIAYASRGLRPSERNMQNYSSMKLELLALKWAMCEKFRGYLLGAQTHVFTDNSPGETG